MFLSRKQLSHWVPRKAAKVSLKKRQSQSVFGGGQENSSQESREPWSVGTPVIQNIDSPLWTQTKLFVTLQMLRLVWIILLIMSNCWRINVPGQISCFRPWTTSLLDTTGLLLVGAVCCVKYIRESWKIKSFTFLFLGNKRSFHNWQSSVSPEKNFTLYMLVFHQTPSPFIEHFRKSNRDLWACGYTNEQVKTWEKIGLLCT